MTPSLELPDDTAALCAAVSTFIRPGLRETRAITIADAFAEEVQLRASEFAAEHNALIELAAVVRGEVRADLRQAHPDWRLEALLTEELQLRKADADEAARLTVEAQERRHLASIASMQTTIDNLAQANECLTQKFVVADVDRAALREKLRSDTAEIIGKHFVELLDETIRGSVRDAHYDDLCAALAKELRLRAAEQQMQIDLARGTIQLAIADRDAAVARAKACEASLRKMEEDRSTLSRRIGAACGVTNTLRAEIARLKEAIVSLSLANADLQATRLHSDIDAAARAGADASSDRWSAS